MYPNTIHSTNNLEDYVFNQLRLLSDNYYVFHSFNFINDKSFEGKKVYDGEIDFLIFNPSKGMIILEVKSGVPYVKNGEWYYQSGIKMSHGGPFEQAKNQKYAIKELIRRKDKTGTIAEKLFIQHAVCFPSISYGQLLNIDLPVNSPRDLIISNSDFDNIENKLNDIFDKSHLKEKLDKKDVHFLMNQVLAPTFNLIPVKGLEKDLKDRKYIQLLKEQSAILEFLVYQKAAAISGDAGTGKTMIALEKARQLAEKQERVLFLCYNRKLKDHLVENYKNQYIDYYTIDQLASKYPTRTNNVYQGLANLLEKKYVDNEMFEYNHTIIDEGQDFGNLDIENAEILKNLKLLIEINGGYFYIFYDKNQLVQGDIIPNVIKDSECKMVLYKNCRNTENIAITSMKFIDKNPLMYDNSIKGNLSKLYFEPNIEDSIEQLKKVVDEYKKRGYEDIVILSLKADYSSFLNTNYKNHTFEGNVYWTTSRKFKGLEADVVILIDVDKKVLTEDHLLFYVASSRAKHELSIILTANDDDLIELINHYGLEPSKRNPKYILAAQMNAEVSKL